MHVHLAGRDLTGSHTRNLVLVTDCRRAVQWHQDFNMIVCYIYTIVHTKAIFCVKEAKAVNKYINFKYHSCSTADVRHFVALAVNVVGLEDAVVSEPCTKFDHYSLQILQYMSYNTDDIHNYNLCCSSIIISQK